MSALTWAAVGAAAAALGGVVAIRRMRRPPIPADMPVTQHGLYTQTVALYRRNVGVAGGDLPMGVHRYDANIYAAFYAAMRDVYFPEGFALRRELKEVVATGVSVSNQCTFCQGNHSAIIETSDLASNVATALAEQQPDAIEDPLARAAATWALAAASDAPVDSAMSREQTIDALATAVFFHYINRVMDALGPQGLALKMSARPPAPIIAKMLKLDGGLSAGPGMQAVATLTGFDTAVDVPEADKTQVLRWTNGNAALADPVLLLWSTIRRVAYDVFDARVLDTISRHLAEWNGGAPPFLDPWREDCLADLEPGSELWNQAYSGLTVARVAYQVDRERLRAACGGDRRLQLILVSYSALAAALRIAEWHTLPVE